MEMVSNGMLEPEKMPPTQRAAYFHGLRAHLQIVTWKLLDTADFQSKPEDRGWQVKNGGLVPVMTDKDVAPECLLLDVNVNLQKTNVNQTDVHVRSTILAVWRHVGNVMVKTVITRRFVKYIYSTLYLHNQKS